MPNPLEEHEQQPVLQIRGVSKQFPGVLANDQIDLDIFRFEIHALLGENGAGKSTLMKILYGFYRADSGQILHQGIPCQIHSPQDARKLQIGMVFQEHHLLPAMSVAENIALFLPEMPMIFSREGIANQIKKFSAVYKLDIDPEAMVS